MDQSLFAGIAFWAGVETMFPAFAPFTRPVLNSLVAVAEKQKMSERDNLAEKLQTFFIENTQRIFGDRIHQKPAALLSVKDVIRLTMLTDGQMTNLPPPLEVEALKAQIILRMDRAAKAGIAVDGSLSFYRQPSPLLWSGEARHRLRQERDALDEALNPGVRKPEGKNSPGVTQDFNLMQCPTPLNLMTLMGNAFEMFLTRYPDFDGLDDFIRHERKRLVDAQQRFGVAESAKIIPLPVPALQAAG